MSEVIAAIASPPGVGAVSLIRVSGKGALDLLRKRFLRTGNPVIFAPRKATLAFLCDDKGEHVDEVLATFFPGPHSYTGEDTIEITGHGGVLVTQRCLEAILSAGIRLAHEGEFSERAFFHGKLDLTQAEAVMDLISAQSDVALAAARDQMGGGIGCEVNKMRASMIALVGELEAYIDFPEEDISPETGEAFVRRLNDCRTKIEQLLETEDRGRMIREGVRVVIVGKPNAGKSALLNRLLGFDRAIVSDVAGTTRDTVEEMLHIGGVGLRLIDTAGLREATDDIERQGIERSRKQLEHADVVIEVVDGGQPRERSVSIESVAHICVVNKADQTRHKDFESLRENELSLSCLTGEGSDELIEKLRELVKPTVFGSGQAMVAINQRHRDCLTRARDFVSAAIEGFQAGAEAEFVAFDLREALDVIGEVTGKVDTEEVLGEIFGRFCIGK